MRKTVIAAVGAVAALGLSAPVMAQDWSGGHHWQHDRLEQRHDNAHDELGEEHDQAHEQGLSPWEHRQLHQDLQYQHDEADYRLARQHQRQHQRDWQRRRRYGNYDGYNGY